MYDLGDDAVVEVMIQLLENLNLLYLGKERHDGHHTVRRLLVELEVLDLGRLPYFEIGLSHFVNHRWHFTNDWHDVRRSLVFHRNFFENIDFMRLRFLVHLIFYF